MTKETQETKQLDELFILIGKNAEGREGVASFVDPNDGQMKPALGDRSRMEELQVVGQALANASGITLHLTRWSLQPDYEILSPEGKE